MHKTPKWIFEEIAKERPLCERQAAFHDHECGGRSTMEHCFTYGGKQIDEKWAIIRLCERAHAVGPYALDGILDKKKNRWIALGHATREELAKYPRAPWDQLIQYLNSLYGKPKH